MGIYFCTQHTRAGGSGSRSGGGIFNIFEVVIFQKLYGRTRFSGRIWRRGRDDVKAYLKYVYAL